jgi:hypothetical protein
MQSGTKVRKSRAADSQQINIDDSPAFERYATSVAAFIRLAMIRIMLRATCGKCFAR